ncbi:hypothetical protein JTB14_035268 [Gonioctena quinquepunctata]|nr:hypothetical protein JTB14_035268 [Gonioctena quinquepunctata]
MATGGSIIEISSFELPTSLFCIRNSDILALTGITIDVADDGDRREYHLQNIELEGITNFGINIQQDYKAGEGTGIPAEVISQS